MTKHKGPELTVEIGTRGVTRIVVETARGERAQGTALLRQILPAIDQVNEVIVRDRFPQTELTP